MSEWVTVKQWSPTTRRGTWRNVTYRHVIDADTISVGGGKIRITLKAAQGRDLAVAACFVGKSDAAGDPDLNATPTRVTFFGGNHYVTMNDGRAITSDEITFNYDPDSGDALVISFYLSTYTNPADNKRLNTAGLTSVAGTDLFWCYNDHSNDTPAGMGGDTWAPDPQYDVVSISKIEIYDDSVSFTKYLKFDFGVENIPAPGIARYWGLIGGMLGTNTSNNAQYAEIDFLDAEGNSITGAGEAIASTQYSNSFIPSFAYDNDLGTSWAALGSIGQFIGYDFLDNINASSIKTTFNAGAYTEAWKYYIIGHSTDGLYWTPVHLVDDSAAHNANEERERAVIDDVAGEIDISVTAPHRYWRILTTQQGIGNAYQQINRIQLLATDLTTNLVDTVGGTASASIAQAGFPASAAFTSDTGTRWADTGNSIPCWLAWDFGSPQTVRGYKMRSHASSETSMPIGWKFQCSDDNITWKTAHWVVNEPTWNSEEERTYPQVGASLKFDYRVRTLADITKDLIFDNKVGAALEIEFEFDYTIRFAPFAASLDFDYGIGVVTKSFEFDYIVYGVVIKDFVFSYNIAYVEPISADYTFDYGITDELAANLEFDYEIYFEPPKPIYVDFKFDAGVDENEVPFVLIPETPVIEVWSYDTAKAVSYDGTEQRAALRSEPKTMLEYTYILDEADRTQVYRQMLNNIRGLFVVPLFANATETLEPMSAGNTTVYCDLTRTDIRVGNRVYYTTSRADVYGTAFVESVGNGFFTVVGGVSIDLPAGSWVMPMRETFITDGGSIAMASMSGESTFVFVSANRRKLVRPAAATGLVAEFDGLPLLDLRPLADNDVDEEFTANVRYITQASDVPPAAFSTWNMPAIEGEREYLARRPLDMDYWREFADKTVGQRSSFLVPSFRPDLTPVPGLSAGADVRVHGEHYWSWGAVDSYSRLRFETSAGVYNRKVSSVSRIGGNTAIVLDTALPAADILRISYLNRVRLATNDIRLEHHDMQSLVTIGIRTVNE